MAGQTGRHRLASTEDDRVTDLWNVVTRSVNRAQARLQDALRSAFNLSEAEADTLVTLGRTDGHRAPMTALAGSARFTSGGFTKIADRLTARDLVRRVPCADDRRVTYLELTPSGVELSQDVRCLVADINRAQFVDVLGPERAELVAQWAQEMSDAG